MENTSIHETTSYLQMIRENFGDRPNLMTEYSGMSWMQTARFINHVIVEANASGYVYWEMMRAAPSEDEAQEGSSNAMLTVDEDGEYELTPFYYVIKHFARHVDEGYRRIDVDSENGALPVSAYVHPEEGRLTLIVINPFGSPKEVELEVADRSIQGTEAARSTADAFFQEVEGLAPGEPLDLPGTSITTVVLDV